MNQPSFPLTRKQYRHEGEGAYLADSGRIPGTAWLGVVAFVAVAALVVSVGAAVFY